MMLPILQISENRSVNNSIIAEDFITRFKLTEEDKLLKTKIGHSLLRNRIYWSVWYLKKAGYITPKNGMYHITDSGKILLKRNPKKIDRDFLLKHSPEYANYVKMSKSVRSTNKDTDSSNQTSNLEDDSNSEQDPEDRINYEYEKYRKVIEDELLDRIKSKPAEFLETIAVELVEKITGGKGERTGKSGDRGIDGYVKLDKLGTNTVAIQAKRYKSSVPVDDVRSFGGAISGSDLGIKNGVFVTTSTFSKEAYEFVKQNNDVRITLIDGDGLKQYLYDYKMGVKMETAYSINKIDDEYFSG